MELERHYAIIQWEDMFISIIDVGSICKPRKAIEEYREGEIITAKFRGDGNFYQAVISEINVDKKYLEKKKKEGKLKHEYACTQIARETSTEKDKPEKEKSGAPVSKGRKRNAKLQNSKNVGESEEKRKKKEEERKEKSEKAEAIKATKQKTIENLDRLIQQTSMECSILNITSEPTSRQPQTPTITEPQTPTITEPLTPTITEPLTPTITDFTDTSDSDEDSGEDIQILNSKGYPTQAQKQPRQIFGKTVPIINSVVLETCSNCKDLQEELVEKNRLIAILEAKIRSLESNPIAGGGTGHIYSRTKPGLISNREQAAKMIELLPDTGVYLYEDDLAIARKKINKKSTPDGKAGAVHLMNVFFTKEELLNKSLTASNASKFPSLPQSIIEAIIGFSLTESSSTRGEITRAIRSKLTLLRCKSKSKITV